ncbi:MAG: hydrogenase/urease maturation nickel metallochaperone HypA [bacterium]
MHDFHLADIIFKTILEHAEKNSLNNVKSATVDLGSIVEHGEEVLPENVKFNVDMLSKGTLAEGIVLKINKITGHSWILREIEGDK